MKQKDQKIKIGMLLLFGVLVVVVALVFSSTAIKNNRGSDVGTTEKTLNDEKAVELIISPEKVVMNVGDEPLFLKVALKDGVDVTKDVKWYSDDESVVSVGNGGDIQGRIVAAGEGETVIGAFYKGVIAEAVAQVEIPKLSVACTPTIGEVAVGENVQFVGHFNDIGVPNYIYNWSGDDGLSGEMGIITWTYETPGVKQVQFKAYDQVGAQAEAECSVNVTSNSN